MGGNTMRRNLSYGFTTVLFLMVWWWAYVRPMDEARSAILDCMDEAGEIDGSCTKAKREAVADNGNQTGQGD